METLKNYYSLIKPGIIYGNIITFAAGFFLASKNNIDLPLLVISFLGLAFVIAAGCVFNNIYDKDIDARMERTKNRVLVIGKIEVVHAGIFGTILLAIGVFLLYAYTNVYALAVTLAGAFIYLLVYTPLKHRSIHATLLGAFSGIVPPIVGYAAVANRLDFAALILGLMLLLWQMPHFYAIGIYRKAEYENANIPILPVQKSISVTRTYMLGYIILFFLAALSLYFFKFVGMLYLLVTILVTAGWLYLACNGFFTKTEEKRWARKMFLFSLVTLLFVSAAIPLDVAIRGL